MRGALVPWVNKRGRIQLRATVKRTIADYKCITISVRAGDTHGQVPSYESWGHLDTYVVADTSVTLRELAQGYMRLHATLLGHKYEGVYEGRDFNET